MPPSAMRVVPVECARLAVDGTGLQRALADADDRYHLGVIAGGENLVGIFEIAIAQRAFDNGQPRVTQELDRALARDAGQERAVCRRRMDDAVPSEKHVRAG